MLKSAGLDFHFNEESLLLALNTDAPAAELAAKPVTSPADDSEAAAA